MLMITLYAKLLSFKKSLVDARIMLLVMAEQVFLPRGNVWSKGIRQIQSAQQRRKRTSKDKQYCLCFSFLAIKYEFYFTIA